MLTWPTARERSIVVKMTPKKHQSLSDEILAHFDIIDIYNLLVALKLKKSCFDTKFQCFFIRRELIWSTPLQKDLILFIKMQPFIMTDLFFDRIHSSAEGIFPLILQKDFILFFKIQFLKTIRHFHGRNIFSCPSAKEIFSGFSFLMTYIAEENSSAQHLYRRISFFTWKNNLYNDKHFLKKISPPIHL